MDIASWLRELGLERYEQAFLDNAIDAEILPKLTVDDLRDIGVVVVGHRRRLLEAIAALTEAASVSEAKPCAPDDSTLRADATQAERRQLTIVFVDLVGSTELSARLDPEDTGAVMRSYQNAVAGEITRFEGHVAKYLGDGVLAYFGYPKAHEDEAERAVRAALSLIHAVGELTTPADQPLAARVGIATGLVVVGELIGEGSAKERTVVGETPNLAARLQALAEPGGVVIASSTRHLVGELFEFTDLGAHHLKGFAKPITAFNVEGERTIASRFEARSATAMLPMMGRDHELALLLDRWALTEAGEGQGVLLVGEAGIGKSRITRALLDALGSEPHTRIRYQCSPYHTDSALWSVIQQLNYAAQIAPGDTGVARLDKLEALLEKSGGRDAAPLIADLIGLDGAERYGELDLNPQMKRARTLDALVAQLLALAAVQPVLIVVEDAHWIDPTTLELVEHCLDRIATACALIVITSRPEQQPVLASRAHVTRLTLNHLGRAGMEAIIGGLAGADLPKEIIDRIIDQTDGIPLFVEELTKAVLETGEAKIPASLQDSLMARLDGLPRGKDVAQVAACIGREFDVPLLAAAASRPEAEINTGLKELAVAELVFRRGTSPDARYTFKHALLRDAAYESLLKSRRQELHEKIANALEAQFPQIVTSEPEILAHHYSAAGTMEKAFQYWLEAGRRSAESSANLEAIQHLNKARDHLAMLPDSAKRAQRELDVLMLLGPAYTATKGFTGKEAEQAYTRVRELCLATGEVDQMQSALQGLRVLYMARGNLAAAAEIGRELLTLGRKGSSLSHQFDGHLALGIVDACCGRVASGRSHLEQALSVHDPDHLGSLAQQPTGNPAVTCLGHLSHVLFVAGFPDQSRKRSRESIDMARASLHPFSLAQALGSAGLVNFHGRPFFDEDHATALVTVAEEQGFDFWHAQGLAMRGWAKSNGGRPKEGLDDLHQAIAAAENMGALLINVFALNVLAATLGLIGETRQAFLHLAEQRQVAARSGVEVFDASAWLIEGELWLKCPKYEPSRVETCFRNALSIAQRQQSKLLELRAAIRLARLWLDQNKRAEAHELLAPIYGWFTEGFDTTDLIEAKALLDELP